MTKSKFLFYVFAFLFSTHSFGQLDSTYRPVKLTGQIPTDLLTNVKEETMRELASDDNSFDPQTGKGYYAMSNYAFKQAMQNGQVYFNDEFSKYLGGIADRLLADDPELRSSIRIYATRLAIPNAAAWRNGVVFFNMPLFSYMQSEAQIAYVLAHEITHFKNKHILQRYKKKMDLQKSIINNSKEVDELFELMRFSRENELEADLEAFDMILKTDYAPSEALEALKQLKEINTSSVYFRGNIESLFNFPDSLYEFHQRCDSIDFDSLEEIEETPDSLSTHPNIEIRMAEIIQKLGKLEDGEKGELFLAGEEQFDKIKDMAYFEQIQNMYERSSYVPTMYSSLRMAAYYPRNPFLQESVAKSLYWIIKISKEGNRKMIIPDPDGYTGTYGMFLCFFRKKSVQNLQRLAIAFMEDRAGRFPESETISIYRAKNYLIQKKHEEAKLGFVKYLAKFPAGKHTAYARLKIEELNEEISE